MKLAIHEGKGDQKKESGPKNAEDCKKPKLIPQLQKKKFQTPGRVGGSNLFLAYGTKKKHNKKKDTNKIHIQTTKMKKEIPKTREVARDEEPNIPGFLGNIMGKQIKESSRSRVI